MGRGPSRDDPSGVRKRVPNIMRLIGNAYSSAVTDTSGTSDPNESMNPPKSVSFTVSFSSHTHTHKNPCGVYLYVNPPIYFFYSIISFSDSFHSVYLR